MSHPVVVVRPVEKVGRLIELLKRETHAAFPVVEGYMPSQVSVRHSIITLLLMSHNIYFYPPPNKLYRYKT